MLLPQQRTFPTILCFLTRNMSHVLSNCSLFTLTQTVKTDIKKVLYKILGRWSYLTLIPVPLDTVAILSVSVWPPHNSIQAMLYRSLSLLLWTRPHKYGSPTLTDHIFRTSRGGGFGIVGYGAFFSHIKIANARRVGWKWKHLRKLK